MTMNYQFYIVRDSAICGGEPVIRGTRVTLRSVLVSLAEGMKVIEILQDFPTLDEKAVRAVIAFAAVSAEEDLPLSSCSYFSMKIKLDENLPARLVPFLIKLGHQVDTVADEGLTGRPDTEVWHRVNQESRFLITQDLDFSDTRQF